MRIRTTLSAALVGAALVLMPGLASAHHSLVAQFSLDKPIALTGTLTKLEWKNPHGWLYMDVKNADGVVEKWAVETGSTARMKARGLKIGDFSLGKEIIVSGFAARDGTRNAAGMTVTFPERETALPRRESTFLLGR